MFTVEIDGSEIAGPFETYNDAWVWILQHQGQSVMYAMEHGGYSIREVAK